MVTPQALILALALSSAGDTVLLEFSAPWCGPCRSMEPTLQRLTAAGYPLRKIDIEREPQIAAQYRVSSVPCFVMISGGREVDRVVGAVSHARLLKMFQQARVAPAGAHGQRVRGQSPDPPRGPFAARERGVHGGPAGDRLAAVDHAAPGSPPGPFAAAADTRPAAVARALAATVRLRVEDERGFGYGTGTVIDRHGQEALVATCGHLFRDSAGQGVIDVDLFVDGRELTVPGSLISYNLKRDIALVSIAPGVEIEPVRVAAGGAAIARGSEVFSIGCDRGKLPSVRQSRVTAIDKYDGPPNIEVAGQPVSGRSGGGLFSADGYLIGICNAADPADNEGIYASLPTIHWELDRVGQRRVYQPQEAAFVRHDTPAQPLQAVPASAMDPPGMPAAMSPAAPLAAAGARQLAADDDTEVICILRSRSDPQAGQRLLILDHPSRELLDRLSRESQSGFAPQRLAQQPSRGAAAAGGPVVRAQSADR